MINRRVSTIIPTYNALQLLKANLPSVFACLQDGDEVVIVDDASSDSTVGWLKREYGLQTRTRKNGSKKIHTVVGSVQYQGKTLRLVVVKNHRNLRYARSVNRGVEVAKHGLLLMLNNDVIPEPDILEYLIPHFSNDAVFGVACLETATHENNAQSGKNELFFARGMFLHKRADDLTAGETAWVTGGSGMFDRAKWEQLGGFDPDYHPAYWEDIDLSHRARKRGWKVLFEPQAQVIHNHETTNKSVFGELGIQQMSWRSAHTFLQKHASFGQRLQHWLWKPYWWWKFGRWQQGQRQSADDLS